MPPNEQLIIYRRHMAKCIINTQGNRCKTDYNCDNCCNNNFFSVFHYNLLQSLWFSSIYSCPSDQKHTPALKSSVNSDLSNSYSHCIIKITALYITIHIQYRYLYFLQCTKPVLPYDNIISGIRTAWFRWSRRESNPCPKTYPLYFYERSLYINIPSGSPVQTRYCFQ